MLSVQKLEDFSACGLGSRGSPPPASCAQAHGLVPPGRAAGAGLPAKSQPWPCSPHPTPIPAPGGGAQSCPHTRESELGCHFGLEDPTPEVCTLRCKNAHPPAKGSPQNEASFFDEQFGKIYYDFRCSLPVCQALPPVGVYPSASHLRVQRYGYESIYRSIVGHSWPGQAL